MLSIALLYSLTFNDAEEEASKEETDVSARESSADGNDGPEHHDTDEELGRIDPGDEHVGGDTHKDVTDEEDGDACLVLSVGDAEVVLERAETSESDSISVEVCGGK